MITYKNERVGCPTEMGCMGDSCPNRNVPNYICDKCNEEVSDLFEYESEQLCKYCLLEEVPKVKEHLR